MHHLGRHAVACFLTRGGCYISWERGAAVFEEWLIDHEVACNVGNWQWLSCTAFFSSFFRCYSPIAFPQKTDKHGEFVRRYVPELKDYPGKYIYEPWKAPVVDQRRAGCLIKGDGMHDDPQGDGAGEGAGKGAGRMLTYPKPMFDFNARRTICLDGMKTAYGAHLYGDSPKVLDGSWRELFDDSAEGPTEGTHESQAPTSLSHDAADGGAGGKRRRGRVKGGMEEASGEMGVDEDEAEAAERGEGTEKKMKSSGEKRLGEKRSGEKRKRKTGQGTLDAAFIKEKGKKVRKT